MTLTPSNCNDCGTVLLSFTVSPVSGVGQVLSIAGISKLGNNNSMVGSGVRIR
jgi:hypothetical protein